MKEYVPVGIMSPTASALDMLQGEEKAHLGLLLPTIASLFNAFAGNQVLAYYFPLFKSLSQGLKKRRVD